MLPTENLQREILNNVSKNFICFRWCQQQLALKSKNIFPSEITDIICQQGIECEKIGQAFLKLTKEGEQQKVEVMLKKYSWLANYKGNVTDLSERDFAGITGFQCAVWDRDWHMYSMYLKYMHKYDVCRQLQDMATGSWVAKHGSFASWQNLIDALDTFAQLCVTRSWSEAEAQWENSVREAQLALPAHAVNEYCNPNHNFKFPDFTDNFPLPRLRIVNKTGIDWFEYLRNGQCAFIRYSFSYVAAVGGESKAADHGSSCDRRVLATLLEIREAQCNQLFTDYLGSEYTSQIKFNP
jgi:hypothetical protein